MSTILTALNAQLFQQGSNYREHVQRASNDATFAQDLVNTVNLSKTNKSVQVAAANALTILVAARVELPKDLAGIQVPGAILDEGCFDQTNFEGSDLSSASLCRTWLGRANLKRVNLTGTVTESGAGYTTRSGVGAMVVVERRSLVVYGDTHGRIGLWDYSDYKLLREFIAHIGQIMAVALTKDGEKFLTCGSADAEIKVWSLPNCDLIRSIDTLWAGVFHAAVSTTEDVVVACEHLGEGSRREIKLWDFSQVASQRPQFTLKKEGSKLIRPRALDFSPCGRYFASITATTQWSHSEKAEALNPHLYIWNRTDGTCVAKIQVVGGGSHTVQFSRNGQLVATPSGLDVIVWRLAESNRGEDANQLPMELQEYARLTGHLGDIRSLQFCQGDNTLAVGSDDGRTYLWNIEQQIIHAQFDARIGRVWCVYCTQDGSNIFTGGSAKKLCVWEKARILRMDPARMNNPWHMSYIHGTQTVATADTNGNVQIWDCETGRSLNSVNVTRKAITHLNVSSDGSLLVSSTDSTNHIFIHNAKTGEVIARLGVNTKICAVRSTSFTPDNKHLVAVCEYSYDDARCLYNNRISVWNIEGQRLLHTKKRVFKKYYLEDLDFVRALTNELALLVVTQRGRLLLWRASEKDPHLDIALGKEDRQLSAKLSWYSSNPTVLVSPPKVDTWHNCGMHFDYSPEKNQLAASTLNKDKNLCLRAFDCRTGKVAFRGGRSIYSAYFANGERMASVTYLSEGGRAIQVYETTRGGLVQTALLGFIQAFPSIYSQSKPLFKQSRQSLALINNGGGLAFIDGTSILGVAKLANDCAHLRWCTNTTLEVKGADIQGAIVDPALMKILKEKGAVDSSDPRPEVRSKCSEKSPLLGRQKEEDPGCCSIA